MIDCLLVALTSGPHIVTKDVVAGGCQCKSRGLLDVLRMLNPDGESNVIGESADGFVDHLITDCERTYYIATSFRDLLQLYALL